MVIGIIFGAIIWLLFELNKAFKKPEFTGSQFILLNWVPFLTNLICGLVILWARDSIEDYFIVTKFSSVILGMAGQGIFKKLSSIFNKDIGTFIGINKKND